MIKKLDKYIDILLVIIWFTDIKWVLFHPNWIVPVISRYESCYRYIQTLALGIQDRAKPFTSDEGQK